jgi:hypothetical protein
MKKNYIKWKALKSCNISNISKEFQEAIQKRQ